jgi:hypothetical protein
MLLAFLAGQPWDVLGLSATRWLATTPPEYIRFKQINLAFASSTGSAQALHWLKTALNAAEAFAQVSGLFGIQCRYVDVEDRDMDVSELHDDTPHYVWWYADRRILFVNPSFRVAKTEDLVDVDKWLCLLFEKDGLSFSPKHNRIHQLMLKVASVLKHTVLLIGSP